MSTEEGKIAFVGTAQGYKQFMGEIVSCSFNIVLVDNPEKAQGARFAGYITHYSSRNLWGSWKWDILEIVRRRCYEH